MMQTLESYDRLPYESRPVTDSHPDFLAVLGRWFGLDTRSPDECRVLELGCASGGNIIPMAFHLPGSEFVGVELSAAQVEDGRAVIRELQLSNVQILHKNIMDVGDELGSFDYIVVHGVYSWVPHAVQDRILELCSTLLRPGGIAYVSYNTLPGWRLRGMTRDMLLCHSRDAGSVEERLAKAGQMLDFLEVGLRGRAGSGTQWLRQEVAHLRKAAPSYLYHEYLEETNEPVLFRDFMGRAGGHGLQYLADTELHAMFPSTLGPEVAELLADFDDVVEQEQYMDFLRLRPFRQTLLCHADRRLEREIQMDRLSEFGLLADLTPQEKIDLSTVESLSLMSADGIQYTVSHPLTKASIVRLAYAFPNALSLARLGEEATELLRALGQEAFAEDRDSWVAELFSLYASGGLQLTTRKQTFLNDVPERPVATALARVQARSAMGVAASARHGSVELDEFAARLLERLDGTRERGQLVDDLIAVQGDGGVSRDSVAENVERLLFTFARHGLLDSKAPEVG